mmetsp:Transcript_1666/g.7273  ORF Transcript_1666/g.7273 Transcript_1666/m.7273 type:complete len:240 (+) Transcript_1666:353-1072(+)
MLRLSKEKKPAFPEPAHQCSERLSCCVEHAESNADLDQPVQSFSPRNLRERQVLLLQHGNRIRSAEPREVLVQHSVKDDRKNERDEAPVEPLRHPHQGLGLPCSRLAEAGKRCRQVGLGGPAFLELLAQRRHILEGTVDAHAKVRFDGVDGIPQHHHVSPAVQHGPREAEAGQLYRPLAHEGLEVLVLNVLHQLRELALEERLGLLWRLQIVDPLVVGTEEHHPDVHALLGGQGVDRDS